MSSSIIELLSCICYVNFFKAVCIIFVLPDPEQDRDLLTVSGSSKKVLFRKTVGLKGGFWCRIRGGGSAPSSN